MAKNARTITSKDIARFKAMRAAKAARADQASNDNTPVKSAYVNTTMTPGMLAACVEAAGIGQ